jgi:Zn-dependent protease
VFAARPHRSDDRATFRLLGIEVRVEPWFFLIIALLGLAYEEPIFIASWVAIAFVSVLLHEMGHAVAFRSFGLQPRILLHGFGGLTSGEGHLTPWRSIAVSLAGPLAPLVLIGLPALWADANGLVPDGDARVLFSQVVFINIAWSVLNLIPVLPLDGGNVTASAFDLVLPGRGRKIAAGISLAVLAGLALLSLAIGYVFGLFLAVWFGFTNLQELRAGRDDGANAELLEAQRALLGRRGPVAEAHARRALAARPRGEAARWATEVLAWSRLWQGDQVGASTLVPAAQASPSLTSALAVVAAPRTPAGPPAVPPLVPGSPLGTVTGSVGAPGAGSLGEARTRAAWALVHDPNPVSRALLGLVLAAGGDAPAVADQLVHLTDAGGPERARELRDVLAHLGLAADAAAVGARLDR